MIVLLCLSKKLGVYKECLLKIFWWNGEYPCQHKKFEVTLMFNCASDQEARSKCSRACNEKGWWQTTSHKSSS
jgi:hypothetical protein